MKKGNKQENLVNLAEFLPYMRYPTVAFNNWRKIHTVILREILCYHVLAQILCYYGNIMNIFRRKSLILEYKKQPVKCKKYFKY